MDEKTQAQLKEIFDQLPRSIQNAITSADVQKKMREAANIRKLHLDQWEILEKEVLMTLFGLKPINELQENIKKEVGVAEDVAADLTWDISKIVFEPIREELERELEHPEAKEKEVSKVEAAREQVLNKAVEPVSAVSQVAPATPPPPPPAEKAIRMPASGAYMSGETSVARKDVHDDPYRESPT